ncbi:replication terminator protein [Bacillus cereus]|nr:replication terminator protein [Bacillus cereus]
MIDLNSFANGALSEQFNNELQKVIENIADQNTDPTKARKIVITLSVSGDKKRDVLACKVQTKSSLIPANEAESKIVMEHDGKGNMISQEMVSGAKGQTFISSDGEILDDVGKPI